MSKSHYKYLIAFQLHLLIDMAYFTVAGATGVDSQYDNTCIRNI